MPRCPSVFRSLHDLTPTELLGLITQLQLLLYQGEDGDWEPDQEWDSETLGEISNLLRSYGLAPISPDRHLQHQDP